MWRERGNCAELKKECFRYSGKNQRERGKCSDEDGNVHRLENIQRARKRKAPKERANDPRDRKKLWRVQAQKKGRFIFYPKTVS